MSEALPSSVAYTAQSERAGSSASKIPAPKNDCAGV